MGATKEIDAGQIVYIVTGGASVTLPPPSLGSVVTVVNKDGDATTVGHYTTEKIFGPGLGAGQDSLPLSAEGAFVTVWSDGMSWYVTAGAPDTGWIPVGAGFQNSWGDTTGTPAGYRLQGDRVLLRGQISSGTGGSAAFTLPWAPTSTVVWVPQCNSGITGGLPSGVWGSSYIYVDTNGDVIPAVNIDAQFLDGLWFTVD
jgi:hypothetical protein